MCLNLPSAPGTAAGFRGCHGLSMSFRLSFCLLTVNAKPNLGICALKSVDFTYTGLFGSLGQTLNPMNKYE